MCERISMVPQLDFWLSLSLIVYGVTALHLLTCSYWNTAFVYVFAEFFGAVIAAALVLPLYGFGQFGSLFDTRVFKTFGLAVPKHLAQVTHLLPVR